MTNVVVDFKVYLSKEVSNVIAKSIMPEVLTMYSKRSKIELDVDDEGLSAKLVSEDLVAARAALNTIVRLLEASYRTVEVVENVV